MPEDIILDGQPRFRDFTIVDTGVVQVEWDGVSDNTTVEYRHNLGYQPTAFVYQKYENDIWEQLPILIFGGDLSTIYGYTKFAVDSEYLYVNVKEAFVPDEGPGRHFYFFLCSNSLKLPPAEIE